MRSSYDPSFKSELILEMLQSGRSVDETAQIYHLSKVLIQSWIDKILRSSALIFGEARSLRTQAKKRAALLNELGSQTGCKRCPKRNICSKSLVELMNSF